MKIYLMLLTISLFISSSLGAKEGGYSLSTALVGMSMDYTEYDDAGAILDTEKSSFSGIIGGEFKLGYTRVLENNNWVQVGFNLSSMVGQTNYVGS
ncbi:MAG: hypothetical protein Q9M34_09745, partial [Sulfurimonas sp.]|nr:hypothetical protein [Sulfurimonas sp.]